MLPTNAAANNPTATLMTIFVMAALRLVFGLFTVATVVRAPARWPVLSLEGVNSLGFCRASAIRSSPSQPAENTHNEPRAPRNFTLLPIHRGFQARQRVCEYASWRAGRSRPPVSLRQVRMDQMA